jgi:hypothetical protein
MKIMKSKTHQPRTPFLQQANGWYSMLESTKEHNIVKPLKHLLPMRTFVMSLLMLLCSIGLSAQFVTIPDPTFRLMLQRVYPSCFNANGEMNITCNAVLSATRMNIGIN